MIQFDLSRCIGCGRCAFDCFPGAITIDEKKPSLSAPGSCIGCGHCDSRCPFHVAQSQRMQTIQAYFGA